MSSENPTVPPHSRPCPVSIEEAVDAARRGQVLRGVEISDLRKVLEGLAPLTAPVVLRCVDCRIASADCSGLTVHAALEIRSTTFAQPASFAYTTFAERVELAGSTLEHDGMFASAHFQAGARFTGTTFCGNTSFQSTQFDCHADFEWTRFHQAVPFDFARFHERANFHEVRFAEAVTFCMTQFGKTASFRGAECGGLLNFAEAHFHEAANLNLGSLHLRPGGQVALTIDQIGLRQRPNLRRWVFRRKGWVRRLLLRPAIRVHEALQRRWPARQLIDGEDSRDPARLLGAAEQYNMLRDNFRSLPGREREEDRCHYKYKDLLRRGGRGLGLWRFLDWAVYKWCLGYGIHTRRILLTGLGAIFLFALLYWPLASQATIRNFDRNFNALYFSVVTFTTVGYGDYAPMGWIRLPAGVEGLLGMVLTSVFTVSFARKLIR
jgi:hypothetical protein